MMSGNTEEDIMSGGLEHGHELNEPVDPNDDDYEVDEGDGVTDPNDDDDRFTRLERRIESLAEENAQLRRNIPPAEPRRQPEPEPEAEPDWEDLLFRDPAEALRLHGERVATAVETKLRREYQQDRGQTRFWDQFYRDNPDLKEDDDLVRTILHSNMATLGDMPTSQAQEKLADLTRERIMRYSGGKAKRTTRKKPQTEGANPPTEARPQVQKSNVTSLSSLIRSRREQRSNKGAAA